MRNFLARTRASRKPSATNMISAISSKSGTTMAQGLNEGKGGDASNSSGISRLSLKRVSGVLHLTLMW